MTYVYEHRLHKHEHIRMYFPNPEIKNKKIVKKESFSYIYVPITKYVLYVCVFKWFDSICIVEISDSIIIC